MDTNDAVFAAELIATVTLPAVTAPTFVLNEVSTTGVELMNLGAATESAGLSLVRVTPAGAVSQVIAAQPVSAGGFQQVALSLNAGDRVLLIAADGATVLDSFTVKSTPRSRFPDGTGTWFRPTALTPGAANTRSLNAEMVINEMMFDPPSATFFPSGTTRAGQWIERA